MRGDLMSHGVAALALICGMLMGQPAMSAEGPAAIAVIVKRPQQEETIHDNSGVVPVVIALQGAALASGSRLRVLIDGAPYGADQRTLEFTLRDIERGEHALQVQLIDAKNAVVAVSTPVKFHVWRASALFPTRKPTAPPVK